jgi:hypothetical protein
VKIDKLADPAPGGLDVAVLRLLDQVFELGDDLLDRIEIGAVGRQEDEVRALALTAARAALAL